MNQMGNQNPDQLFDVIYKEAERRNNEFLADPVPKIHIGMATCCVASGALETKKGFEEALAEYHVEARIHTVGCMGHCYAGPFVIIDHPASGFPPIMYNQVDAGKARVLVKSFLMGGEPQLEYVYGAMRENDMLPSVMDFSRFSQEKRLILEKCGVVDPEDIYDYIALGGYSSLVKTLKLQPDEVIQEIQKSGLRGRGGAGFPTGKKWEFARQAPGQEKVVICNADEGDPGAYMDRMILESNPHQVIEGLAIAAHAVGAKKAIIYVRAEYPLAVKTVTKAIHQATQLGLLGQRILGADFDLEINVFRGSGAFVCGEETALIQSVEGYRGMPQHRPPYPAIKGLFGDPTVINNVKTLASVPPIVDHGADWYRQIGTKNTPGTAIFSVVGNVVHAGLVEIPTGVTLRSLIFDICGGIPHNKKFKAVQIGGPSGGCLSEEFLDTPIDFDSLTATGAMMGSGGMVVMDEDSCMVEISRYFLDFTQKESCGKCTFCRIGNYHLLKILERITKGEGRDGDIELLETLAKDIKAGSLCGLGKTAPNPVLTSIKYFRKEYEAHIYEKRCPALMCRSMVGYYIDLEKCARGCDACTAVCPVDAVFTTRNRKKGIDQELCVKCGECMTACPPQYDAVRRVSPPSLVPYIEKPPQEEKEKKDGEISGG